MTTLEIIKRAKKELEKANSQENNIISKSMSTPEYKACQIGKAIGLLEIAEDQAELELEQLNSLTNAAILKNMQTIKNMSTEGDNGQRIADDDKAVAGVVCLPADGE